jgi:hypothetical protein
VALLLGSAALAVFLTRRVLARKLRGRFLRRGPA